MGLKGTKQMYTIAKAKATEQQEVKRVRTESGEGFLVGFALMPSEYKQLFYEQGFTRESTIKHYVDLWRKCGWIVNAANGVIFFRLTFEDDDELLLSRLDDARTKILEDGLEDCTFVGVAA